LVPKDTMLAFLYGICVEGTKFRDLKAAGLYLHNENFWQNFKFDAKAAKTSNCVEISL